MIYKNAEDIRELYKAAALRDLAVPAAAAAMVGGALYGAHRLNKHIKAEEKKWRTVDRHLNQPTLLIDGPNLPPGVAGFRYSHEHDAFVPVPKTAGLPTEMAHRKRVPGLKVPRVATPRLGTGTPEGKIPSNPFRGNWVTPQKPQLEKTAVDVGLVRTLDPAFSKAHPKAAPKTHPRYRAWERGAYTGSVVNHGALAEYHRELRGIGGLKARLGLPQGSHGGLVLPGIDMGHHPGAGKSSVLHPIVTAGVGGTPEISTVFHDEMLGGKYHLLDPSHIRNVDPGEARVILKRIRTMSRDLSPKFLTRLLDDHQARKAVQSFMKIEEHGGRRPAFTRYARRLL
jgi:hypothetical protein